LAIGYIKDTACSISNVVAGHIKTGFVGEGDNNLPNYKQMLSTCSTIRDKASENSNLIDELLGKCETIAEELLKEKYESPLTYIGTPTDKR